MEEAGNGARRIKCYFSQELQSSWMGAVVLLCFFISGLTDAVAFNSWNCFVSMQTGYVANPANMKGDQRQISNTIFAALGIGGQPRAAHSQQWYKSLVSIGSFCCGTLFFNALHRLMTGLSNHPNSQRRWIFCVSFLVQMIFIAISATLVTLNLVSNQPFVAGEFSSGAAGSEFGPANYLDLCPVALLAFQAAGQVTFSRVLALLDLPTVVITTLYHDWVADLLGVVDSWKKSKSLKEFLIRKERRQLKRLFSILCLFCGGVVGGEMYKSELGMAGALWMATVLKAAVVILFLCWKNENAGKHNFPE